MTGPVHDGSDAARAQRGVRRIAVMNPKGGCGKTTVATNLASRYAGMGQGTALFDYDPLGASLRWLRHRAGTLPPIQGVAAHEAPQPGMTRSWQLRVGESTRRIIVDTPAGLERRDFGERLQDLDVILIPVLPSPMDIGATADFIRDLLLIGKLRTRRIRVGIVTNRVKANTNAFHTLRRFVDHLDIPVVGQLRETQNYVTAAQQGLGVHELPRADSRDGARWQSLVQWLEQPWHEPAAPGEAPAPGGVHRAPDRCT